MPSVKRSAADTWSLKLPADLERRRASRIHTMLRLARVTRAHDVGLWRVRNISDTGMMLSARVPVRQSEALAIALSDSVTITGRVEWWDGERCGVAFQAPVDCAALLASLVAEQSRPGYRPPRLPVSTSATAYCEKGLHSVRLTELSQHGAGFTHDGCFRPGMAAKLHFPAGDDYRGVVRAEEDGRAELLLTEPIPFARLESAARF